SQVSAAVLQTALVTCSSEQKLSAKSHTLLSRVRKGRKEVTSAKGNDRLIAVLIPFASSHFFLNAFAHTLP
ncbi:MULTISPECIES: hypothetical protein, partial [unclassified Aerococcus]|uniref:hypothetical protein n=1 Tax=unclassified Aerococcus TaxID=2618060 RepID=UPI001AF00940